MKVQDEDYQILKDKPITLTHPKIERFFMSIEEAKFRKIVEPGDTIVMYASILQNRGPVWKFKARSEVDGKIAAETLFTAMVKDKSNQ